MRTLEGQATEVGWLARRRGGACGPEDYLHLIMHKTCWYTIDPPAAGGRDRGLGRHRGAGAVGAVRGLLHGRGVPDSKDDLLNLLGDEAKYGKEIHGDIWEGKRTLPLVHLLALRVGADRVLVRDYLRRNRSETLTRNGRHSAGPDGRLRQHHVHRRVRRRHPAGRRGVLRSRPSPMLQPGPDLDFLRALVPYVWARWR